MNHNMQIRQWAAVIAIGCFACSVLAQDRIQGTATWQWLGSADNAVTWHGGVLEVPQSQASVRIRHVISWAGVIAQRQYFGRSQLDFTVTKTGSASIGDAYAGLISVDVLVLNANLIGSTFGNVLKVDDFADTAPPGAGPFWMHISQPPPNAINVNSYNNPFTFFDIVLSLDGTPGDRVVDAVFRPVTYFGIPFSRHVVIYDERPGQQSFEVYPVITDYQPLIIRVVPTPGVCSVLGLSACLPRRARR